MSLEFDINCWSCKMGEDTLGILIPAIAFQPPRVLGSKRETDREDDRENPLEGTEKRFGENTDVDGGLVLTIEAYMRRYPCNFQFPE